MISRRGSRQTSCSRPRPRSSSRCSTSPGSSRGSWTSRAACARSTISLSSSADIRGTRCSTGPSGRRRGGGAPNRFKRGSERRRSGQPPARCFARGLQYWLADGTERIVDFAMHPIRDTSGRSGFSTRPGSTSPTELARRRLLGTPRRGTRDRPRTPARPPAGSLEPAARGVVRRPIRRRQRRARGRRGLVRRVRARRRPCRRTVGDVVGHGLNAAASMGQLRTALAALAEYAASPGELLMQLDRFLTRTGASDYATVSYGVLDPANGSSNMPRQAIHRSSLSRPPEIPAGSTMPDRRPSLATVNATEPDPPDLCCWKRAPSSFCTRMV